MPTTGLTLSLNTGLSGCTAEISSGTVTYTPLGAPLPYPSPTLTCTYSVSPPVPPSWFAATLTLTPGTASSYTRGNLHAYSATSTPYMTTITVTSRTIPHLPQLPSAPDAPAKVFSPALRRMVTGQRYSYSFPFSPGLVDLLGIRRCERGGFRRLSKSAYGKAYSGMVITYEVGRGRRGDVRVVVVVQPRGGSAVVSRIERADRACVRGLQVWRRVVVEGGGEEVESLAGYGCEVKVACGRPDFLREWEGLRALGEEVRILTCQLSCKAAYLIRRFAPCRLG